MRGEHALKAMFPDPRMKEMIESLWREYPGLYNEKYNRTVGELAEPWLLNIFGQDVEFGQALGQDNSIDANQSTAIGIGAITRAFREIVMGSYGSTGSTTDPLPNPTAWVELDRLLTIGNGRDDLNRSDALILFKSGLLELKKAIKIGPFPELVEGEPKDGTLQYSPDKSLEIWEDEKWKQVMQIRITEQPTGPVNGVNTIFYTSVAYVSGSIALFINGIKEVFFSEVNDRQITLSHAPLNIGFTDRIEVTYLKK
jgi:hypothetical protein